MARFSRRLLIAASGLALVSCLSPTLPLPPPDKPTVEGPDEQGQVTLDGYVQQDADVICKNERTREIRGYGVGADGHYRFQIGAEVGDDMRLWYSVGNDSSPAVIFQVPPPK